MVEERAPSELEVLYEKAAKGEGIFKALCATFLFAYLGFVLAVFLADSLWLARVDPMTGRPYFNALFSDPEVVSELTFSIKLSLVTSAITAVIAIIVAIPAAYALSRYKFPGMTVIDTVLDLPIVVPPLIAGISLLLLFSALENWLSNSPLRVLYPFVKVVYTKKAIVVAQFFVASAFSIRALKAIYDQVNPRFEAVARTLGCTKFQAFYKVTLPLAKNGIVAGLIMTWARAMGEFAPIMVFAGATPFKTEVMPIAAFLNLSAGNIEISLAIVVMMVVVATVTLVIFKKLGGQGYIW